MIRRPVPTVLLGLLVLVAACQGGGGVARPSGAGVITPSAGQPGVYVAIGASETLGIGAAHPNEEAWPQLFYRSYLPRAVVFYDLGVAAETTAAAIQQELPAALALRPTLVTIWLNVDDIAAGVPVSLYEQRLGDLVRQVRTGGRTRVLVANTPFLNKLPAYAACGPVPPAGTPPCPLPGLLLPSATELNVLVDGYNAAVARVAAQEGATLVDLHAQGEVPVAHPDYVSSDGFHPNAAGYAAIAALFGSAYRAAPA